MFAFMCRKLSRGLFRINDIAHLRKDLLPLQQVLKYRKKLRMTKHRLPAAFCLLMMPLLLGACVAASGLVRANAITAPGASPSAYRTYAWYQDEPAAGPAYDKGFGPTLNEHIRRAVEEELQQKGLRKVTQNPDVLVAYDVSVSVPEEKDDPRNFASGFGYSYGYMSGYRYRYGQAGLPGYRAVDLFKEGTLIIDLINPQTNLLVWRGWAEEAISNFNAGYNSVQKQVEEVLGKL